MDLDLTQLPDVVARVRRVQGRLGGTIRMLEAGPDCAAGVTQLSAASPALDKAVFAIVATGLRKCAETEHDDVRRAEQTQLQRLFPSLA